MPGAKLKYMLRYKWRCIQADNGWEKREKELLEIFNLTLKN